MTWTHDTLPLWQLVAFALTWSALVRILAGRVVRDIGEWWR